MDSNALLEFFPILLVNFNQHMVWVLGVLVLGLPMLLAAQNSGRTYNIPAGDASETLLEFVEQSGEQVFFLVERVRGYGTRSIRGEYTSDEALAAMLEGSLLTYVTDDATGAVMVRRIEGNRSDDDNGFEDEPLVLNQTRNSNPEQETDMKPINNNWLKTLTAVLTLGIAGPGGQLSAQEEDEETIYELNPFSISEDENIGYQATTTLAGTRLKTKLRDVGAAISVMTEEFFDDTGATDAATILSYALNIDVGGTQGNFAGGLESRGSFSDQSLQRTNPQAHQRVRGLDPASLTRDYFLTDIPFDSYNTTRVTINRGPNSLLFGIGKSGGVINNTVKQAILGVELNEVSVRFGERSSHRETFDVNREIVKDRLAVRFAGVYDDMQYQQRPAYKVDKRLHAAFRGILLKNENSEFLGETILRGNFEHGRIGTNPPNVIPPGDAISSWFEPPDANIGAITGTAMPNWATDGTWIPKITADNRRKISYKELPGVIDYPTNWRFVLYRQGGDNSVPTVGVPGNPGLQGFQQRIPYNPDIDGRSTYDYWASSLFHRMYGVPGFATTVIMDRNVWDNENQLLTGNTNYVQQDFDTRTVTLEQGLFGGNGGFEFTYDYQEYTRNEHIPFSTGGSGGSGNQSDVFIDVAEYLPGDVPNPNLGRPFIKQGGDNRPITDVIRESYRATLFFELDFKERSDRFHWLGRHLLTAFANQQVIDTKEQIFRKTWDSFTVDVAKALNSQIHGYRRHAVEHTYIGPSLLDARYKSLADVRLEATNNHQIQDGDLYNIAYFDFDERVVKEGHMEVRELLMGGNRTERTIDTEAFSIQSYLFNDNLVGLVGWRTDDQVGRERAGNNRLPSFEWDPKNLELGDPLPKESGDTFTWSIVGHVPVDLPLESRMSFHFNESENFQPVGTRRTVYGDPLGPPTGTTEERGVTFEMFDNRLIVRTNWYETSNQNGPATIGDVSLNALLTGIRNFNDIRLETEPDNVMDFETWSAGTDGRYSSYSDVSDVLFSIIPAEIQALTNYRIDENSELTWDPILGKTVTTAFVAKGFEIDVVGNLTSNWRLALNVGKQETVQSDTARLLGAIVDHVSEGFTAAGLNDAVIFPNIGTDASSTFRDQQRGVQAALAGALVKDGTASTEQRKWRINVTTNYTFTEGFLKNFSAGGAIRWQDRASVGYPVLINPEGVVVPDLSRPFWGSELFNGDLWFGYGKILAEKVDWRIQLNIRNAFGDTDPIPVAINPDGKLAIVRNPNPQEIFLTNTFKF